MRKLIYNVFKLIPRQKIIPADVEIDIIIPLIQKDLIILPLCIEGIRNCITHNFYEIYIVAPKDELILDYCKKLNLVFIDETSIFGYAPNELKIFTGNNKNNRSGWIFQQLIKLSGVIGKNRYFLCIDADHVLIKKHSFISSCNKHIFYQSPEYHKPYYDIIQKLFRNKKYPDSCLSYISHKMIFDKIELSKLQKSLSELHNANWISVIINSLDFNEDSGFSEFEMYGSYINKNMKILRLWKNINLLRNKTYSYDEISKLYSRKFNAVTFPEHLNHIS